MTAELGRTELADGTEIGFRYGRPSDRDALISAFDRLSARSRYLRFFQRMQQMPAALIERLIDVDQTDRVAVVAFLVGDPDTLIGVVRYIRYSEQPDRADVALTVLDDYQGEGLASHMYDLLTSIATSRQIATFTADVLRENTPMLRFFRARGGQVKVDPHDGAAMKVTLDLSSNDVQRTDG